MHQETDGVCNMNNRQSKSRYQYLVCFLNNKGKLYIFLKIFCLQKKVLWNPRRLLILGQALFEVNNNFIISALFIIIENLLMFIVQIVSVNSAGRSKPVMVLSDLDPAPSIFSGKLTQPRAKTVSNHYSNGSKR